MTGLWMRPVYWEGILAGEITTVVRSGDRSDPNGPTFIPLNVPVPVRFLEQMGIRDQGIQPKLYPDDGTTVELVERIVKQIRDLTPDDLAGGSLDISDPERVRLHLAVIGNTKLPDYGATVTVYKFRLLPPAVE